MQSDFKQILNLEQLDTNLFRNRYHQENFKGTLFGGQVLSQALLACYYTQDAVRGVSLPHSMHAYFLRAGNSQSPVIYDVESVRDGRSILSRRVVARQGGRPILNMAASFHFPEHGFEHQTKLPPGIPTPDQILSSGAAAPQPQPQPQPEKGHNLLRLFDILPIPGRDFDPATPYPGNSYSWIRAAQPLTDDPIEHLCVMAFASDLGLLATTLQPHGVSIMSGSVFPASIDHAMWFHSADFRADEWVLCHCTSPWAGNARGFAQGSVYTRDGKLILSSAQEGLIRPLK